MLKHLRLYLSPTEPASLHALKQFRALVDGPWAGRCEWAVVDAGAPGAIRPPTLPALARLEPKGPVWLPVDPAGNLPADALTHPGCTPTAPPGAPPAPLWRALLEASPVAAALFSEGLLVYATPAFLSRYHLGDEATGRRPGEWPAKERVPELETASTGGAAPGLTVARLDGADGADLVSVIAAAEEDDNARPLIDRIRTINHSIGNALVGVMGYGELLQRELEAAHAPSVNRIRAMNDAATRLEVLSQEISAAIRAYLQRSHS